MEPGTHAKDELVGMLLVVSLDDEAIVLCARSHARGLSRFASPRTSSRGPSSPNAKEAPCRT